MTRRAILERRADKLEDEIYVMLDSRDGQNNYEQDIRATYDALNQTLAELSALDAGSGE